MLDVVESYTAMVPCEVPAYPVPVFRYVATSEVSGCVSDPLLALCAALLL